MTFKYFFILFWVICYICVFIFLFWGMRKIGESIIVSLFYSLIPTLCAFLVNFSLCALISYFFIFLEGLKG